MKGELVNKVTRSFNRGALKLKKHSPEIFVVAGVIGLVGSAVMACKATRKLDGVLEEAKENIDMIHDRMEHPETAPVEYDENAYKKDLAGAYLKTAGELAKLYGPAVIVGGLSATAILTGHNITRKRNVALAAAYAASDKAFKDYRGRVVERFGEALDKELRYNIQNKEVEEITVTEDGSEHVEKKHVPMTMLEGYSQYARFYDDGCKGWTKNPEFNLMFLRDQENYANRLLRTKGHLFLNEVYDLLGIPRSPMGQAVGWIYDEDCPNGDNRVDFGIYSLDKPKSRDFVNGYENVILLDFNVDGDIMNMI